MEYKKVEGHPELLRDMNTNAIINHDKSSYQNYIQLRDQKIKEKQKLENLENEINEIKSILKQLVDKL